MDFKMKKTIDHIRTEIDDIDSQLLQLIKRRLQSVKEIGQIKTTMGIPIYDPQREADLINKHRNKATHHNLSADLVENLLKLIIQESYLNQIGSGYKQTNSKINKIIIIGGQGKMGRLFANQFQLSGYQVVVLDREDSLKDNKIFDLAGLVLISVPINKTVEVINSLPKLPNNCVLADITSIKKIPVKAMLKAHQGPVVGLHPMFGPSVRSFANQLIIQCNGRKPNQYQWLIEQITLWGCRIEKVTPIMHDKAMGFIQALRHFTSFVYGSFLETAKVDLSLVLKLSSPIYRLELSLVGRLFAQSPELYADIILASKFNLTIIKRYIKTLSNQLSSLRKEDRDDFIKQFHKTSDYFGEYSSSFLSETEQLLNKT